MFLISDSETTSNSNRSFHSDSSSYFQKILFPSSLNCTSETPSMTLIHGPSVGGSFVLGVESALTHNV
jgi:hypothetical protein